MSLGGRLVRCLAGWQVFPLLRGAGEHLVVAVFVFRQDKCRTRIVVRVGFLELMKQSGASVSGVSAKCVCVLVLMVCFVFVACCWVSRATRVLF